jgi:hypothetical protein
MGVLDDAIREHLELKRQHGAPEEEIAQAEAEALGPARREPPVDPFAVELAEEQIAEGGAPPPPPPPPDLEEPIAADAPVEDLPVAYEEVPGPDAHPPLPDEPIEPGLAEAEHADLAPEHADLPPDPDPAPHEMEPSRPHGDALLHEGEDLGPDPDEVPADERLAPDEPPPPQDPHRATTTILDEPLGEPPAEPTQSGEDVLEETPDFLQETPEHDRLWFEQKPPRDFDLDD